MIYLFYFASDDCYVYTTAEWFSSNFNSLEQLADVGFDDPDKIGLNDPEYLPNDATVRIDHHPHFKDAIYLGCVSSFEELTVENYPELWI